MGNNFKNKPELLRIDITEKTITNEIPPPVGVGFTCELLELGLSIKNFLRNFIKQSKRKQVEKNPNKNIKKLYI